MVICLSLLLVFNSVWTLLSAHSIKFGTNSYTSLWMSPTSNKIDKMIRLKSESHSVIVSSLFCQSHCTQLHWWQLLKIMSKFCFQNSLQNDFANPHSLVEFHLEHGDWEINIVDILRYVDCFPKWFWVARNNSMPDTCSFVDFKVIFYFNIDVF